MKPQEMVDICRELYGDNWKNHLTQILPCSKRAIYYWISGKRKIQPIVAARIRSLQKN